MLIARLVSLSTRALALTAPLTLTACFAAPFWQGPTNDTPVPEPSRGVPNPSPNDVVPPGDDGIPPTDDGGEQSCLPVGGIDYQRPRPNVMLLVDRSGSMAGPDACGQATCPSKWQQLLALSGHLNDIKGHARLGLTVYPAPGESGCGVSGGVLVPLSQASNVDEQILTAVTSIGPDGRTPITEALDQVAVVVGLDDPTRDNVVVLLTAGLPNCACSDNGLCERERAVEAVERLADRAVPIRVDVVGSARRRSGARPCARCRQHPARRPPTQSGTSTPPTSRSCAARRALPSATALATMSGSTLPPASNPAACATTARRTGLRFLSAA